MVKNVKHLILSAVRKMPKVNIISHNPLSLKTLGELVVEVEGDSYVVNQPLSLDYLNLIVDFSITVGNTFRRTYTSVSDNIKAVKEYSETITSLEVIAYNSLSTTLFPALHLDDMCELLVFRYRLSLVKSFGEVITKYAKATASAGIDWRDNIHYRCFIKNICEIDGDNIFDEGASKEKLVESITTLENVKLVSSCLIDKDDYRTAGFLFHKYRHLVGIETFFCGNYIDGDFMKVIIEYYRTQLRPVDIVISCDGYIHGFYLNYPDMFESVDQYSMLIKNNRAQFCAEVSIVTVGNTGKEEDQLLSLLSTFIG
jgi:hypothetical protein